MPARHDRTGDLVLLVGTYRPAVAAARQLHRAGRRVVAGYSPEHRNAEGSGGVEHSRAVERVWRHPVPRKQPEAFLAALRDEVRRLAEPVFVFPFWEPVGVLLSRRRDELPDDARLVSPAADIVEVCVDKERTLETAAAAGLPALPWQVVHDRDALLGAVERLGAVAVRPLNGERVLGQNALLLDGPDDVRAKVAEWPAGHDRLLVQTLARGARIDLHFAARDGEVLGAVEAIAPRMDRLDGTGLGVETITRPRTPALTAQLERLVAHLGYTGVGLAQFLLEPGRRDGWFLELNPRIGGNAGLAHRAGLDLANLAVDLAAGRPIATPLPPVRTDAIRSAWVLGDLAGLRRASTDGALSRREQLAWLRRLAASALRADVHAVWSWRDPLPGLVTWGRYFAAAASPRVRRLSPAPGGGEGA